MEHIICKFGQFLASITSRYLCFFHTESRKIMEQHEGLPKRSQGLELQSFDSCLMVMRANQPLYIEVN